MTNIDELIKELSLLKESAERLAQECLKKEIQLDQLRRENSYQRSLIDNFKAERVQIKRELELAREQSEISDPGNGPG